MKIKEMVINEINDMSPTEYASIYQYIHVIKASRPKKERNLQKHWYHEVCTALEGLSGSLTQDIIDAREDRV